MRKILITGANGFIGRNCYYYFSRKDEVFTIDIMGSSFKNCLIGNVNIKNLKRFNQKFDLIIHLAGSGLVSSASKNPNEEKIKSVDSLVEVLEYIKNCNSKARLIFASSASVYGNNYKGQIKENFNLSPISKYGEYKLECEQICKKYADAYDIDIKVIRFFSLYGKENKKQLLFDILTRLKSCRTKEIKCFGTGNEERDFINVTDAVEFIDIVSKQSVGFDIFNCGTGKSYSVKEITSLILKYSNKKVKQNYDNLKRNENPECLIADISKSEKIGFIPKIDIETGISEYVDWFNSIYKIYFPIFMNEMWMGGVNYYKNLFQAISLLENSPIDIYIPKDNPSILFEFAKPFSEISNGKKDFNYRLAKILSLLKNKKFNKKQYFVSRCLTQFDILSHVGPNYFKEVPAISWIPDFQHLYLKNLFSAEEIKMRDDYYSLCAEKSRAVILSSNSAKRDFIKMFPNYRSKAKVLNFVCYINPDIYKNSDIETKKINSKFNLPDKYFYIPNQFWQHKNHLTLFKAVNFLKNKGINVNVVCSGNTQDYRNNEFYSHVILKFIRDNNLSDRIKILGIIDLNEVYYLMRHCVSVINPSLFEGWSSSVEEVKSLGKNIILSDLDVHKEQNPPNAIYFSRLDYEELANIMENNWNKLPGGPDYELEENAKNLLKKRMTEYGFNYYKIIKDAMRNN